MIEDKKKSRRLLKAVEPVRKAAGEVRDMDVLAGNVLALAQNREDASLMRLAEHLNKRRKEGARELQDIVSAKRKKTQRRLKSYSQLLEKQFAGNRESLLQEGSATEAVAAELAQWPRLNEENIHPFRIKVKQLRYMLQLERDADRRRIDVLGKVKDEVGDWHDWQELATIAEQVLDHKSDKAALREIESIGSRKYKTALGAANELRSRYLNDAPKAAAAPKAASAPKAAAKPKAATKAKKAARKR